MWKCIDRTYKNSKIESYELALYNPAKGTIDGKK